jgi:ATP/maltotriose-dependent transcriptional regulator MalT
MRLLMSTSDDCYDFHLYFAKQDECLTKSPVKPGQLANHPVGPLISLVSSPKEGAMQEYIEASISAMKHTSHCLNGCMAGKDDLAFGELSFYQCDVRTAEPLFVRGLARARECRQFELAHRALFYLMRMAVSQGDYVKAKQALKDMEGQLEENDYTVRFTTYDIALGWYYYLLAQPERVPSWLKEKFAPYGHAYFIENFANQAKARYCYLTRNYSLLLTYMEEQKRRESNLFGRVEMQSMEACIHFKWKNKTAAFAALREAYENASSNNILMPFIELGKDMYALTTAALRDPSCDIRKPWLETVNRRSASYAKYQRILISDYKKDSGIDGEIVLSSREQEVLRDMYHGLSRSEIAVNQNLSINTVKLYINNIYEKLGACNMTDVIRIAAERRLI